MLICCISAAMGAEATTVVGDSEKATSASADQDELRLMAGTSSKVDVSDWVTFLTWMRSRFSGGAGKQIFDDVHI